MFHTGCWKIFLILQRKKEINFYKCLKMIHKADKFKDFGVILDARNTDKL